MDAPCYLDANKQQRQLIAELESKNRLGMNAGVMLFTFALSLAPVFHLPSLYHIYFGPLVSQHVQKLQTLLLEMELSVCCVCVCLQRNPAGNSAAAASA